MAKKRVRRKTGMNPDSMLKHIENIEQFVKNSIVTSQIQIVKKAGCTTLVVTAMVALDVMARVQPKDENLRKVYVWNNKFKATKTLANQVIEWITDYNNRRDDRIRKLTGKGRKRVKGVPSPKKEWIEKELPSVVVRIMNGIDTTNLNNKSEKELLSLVSNYIDKEILNN